MITCGKSHGQQQLYLLPLRAIVAEHVGCSRVASEGVGARCADEDDIGFEVHGVAEAIAGQPSHRRQHRLCHRYR